MNLFCMGFNVELSLFSNILSVLPTIHQAWQACVTVMLILDLGVGCKVQTGLGHAGYPGQPGQ